MKNLVLHNVDIHEKSLKDYALNKKYIAEKDDIESLNWPFGTLNDLWGHNLFNENFNSFKCLSKSVHKWTY